MQRIVTSFCLIALLVSCFGATARSTAQSTETLRTVQRQFNQEVQPLLKAHCLDCHEGDSADAGLDLSGLETIDQLLNARKTWKKIQVRVAAREMPPEDGDPLSDQQHTAFLQWIDQLLNSVDCTEINPGRVTIRRLNRTEYKNTIRDLLDVEYQPAASFPGDDVGYGFDNIADVLSLPPILMEKYLEAAEEITSQAILDPNDAAYEVHFSGKDLPEVEGSRHNDLTHLLTTNGTLSRSVELPQAGRYEIQLTAFGDQAGDEPVKFELRVGDRIAKRTSLQATAESPETFKAELSLPPGKQAIELEFTNDFFDPKLPPNKQDRNLHVVEVAVRGPLGKRTPMQTRWLGKTPKEDAQQRTTAREKLSLLMSRAYRRSVGDGEVDRLMILYDQGRSDGESYELAIRHCVQAILISPYFLYKIEAPTPAGQTRLLRDFELATSLSYFFWSTMPDDELFRLAAQGKLSQPDVYFAQVDRMLADPKSEALVENFVSQWLQLRHLEHVKPDPDLFGGVGGELLDDMATETKLMVAELIRRDASIFELLEADFTFLNQRLAQHYGVEGVQGDQFRRVSADRTQRRGLMTHASVLTLTSNPTRTSPVKRGKWIMENLLGEEPPPPDPAAMKLEDQAELTGTLRQRMEQHRADPNCAVCHKVMDELGFALENYDAVGRWRDREENISIDAHGELPDGTVFEGPVELQATLRETMRKQYVRCLIEKMLIYALGRGLEYYDECAIERIAEKLEQNEYRFSALIRAVVTSDPFVRRRGFGNSEE